MALRWFLALTLLSSLFLPVSAAKAQSLDQYGGYTSLPVPGGATGYFRTAKLNGNRWVLVSPLGNAVWLRGVFNADGSGSIDEGGNSYDNRVLAKYGSRATWLLQMARRIRAWGFNAAVEYSNDNMTTLPSTERLPNQIIARGSNYGFMNQGNYASGAFKDLIEGLTGSAYTGYAGGRLPDVYDSLFQTYVTNRMAAGATDPTYGPILSSPWHLGVTTDDADDLYGFGPGPEVPAAVTQPHPGWIALASVPSLASSARHGVSYSDPKVYAKYAVRDFLQAKYTTVAALNAAWGSAYTSWDSAGGWGTGTGVLDENGRHTAYLGSTEGTLVGANAAVVADLDAFLFQFATKYFSISRTAIKTALPSHLVWGPSTLNGWGGLTRKPILQAAGAYMDVLQAGVGSQQVLDLTRQYAGDIPIVTWEGWPANSDSSLWRYPNPFGLGTMALQSDRGAQYSARLNQLVNFQTGGQYMVAGMKWWAWMDSWGEKTNWGLVSFRDNAYDGREPVIASGIDSWGYPTGGEERNYGNFLSGVVTANAAVAAAIGAGSINPPPPSTAVSITSPTTGSTVQQTVTVSAAASSSTVRINLALDGGLVGIFSGTVAQYPWNTTTSPNGTHQWVAKAYDVSGASVTSSPVAVTVSNAGTSDTTPPVVSITQPTNGGFVGRKTKATIQAAASDNVGVTRVEFYVNGSLKCSVTVVPYSCQWQVPAASPGSGKVYRLQAKTYDAQGNVGSSSIVTVQAQ